MIDYNAFHNYLVELVGLYQRTRSTKGMSQLAQKYHCTAITRDQFYQMKLDKLQPSQVTPQLSRVIRDTIGKSDAKAALRESIGALNEGILAGSRISQGSDRTVQITITQPANQTPSQETDTRVYQQSTIDGYRKLPEVFTMDDVFRCFNYDSVGSACSRLKRLQDEHLAEKIQTGSDKGKYRKIDDRVRFKAGHVVMRKGREGRMLYLIDKMYPDSFGWHYGMVFNEDHTDNILHVPEDSVHTCPLNPTELRLAKGSEVARFLGALTREGYLWEADNVNGLFTVKGKKVQRREQPVEVFACDIPLHDYDNTGIHSLPAVNPSLFRFALGPLIPIDNGGDLMTPCHDTQMLNAVVRQLKTAFPDFDHIRELFQYEMPALCCSEDIKEYRVALVKDDNNGACYWLARDRDVLRLLSWISFVV